MNIVKTIVYCNDYPDFKCCHSCHYDWDDGYDEPMETEIDENTMANGCCTFGDWIINKLEVKNENS